MIPSVPPPMYQMPQEHVCRVQQYCQLGQSRALGDLVAQHGQEDMPLASSSFVACMHKAELLEQEAVELRAVAVQKDMEAASKPLAALDSFNIALSSTPAHQLWELIRIWKDAWWMCLCQPATSGTASTSMMPACTTPVSSAVLAPIIASTVPNVSGMIVSM